MKKSKLIILPILTIIIAGCEKINPGITGNTSGENQIIEPNGTEIIDNTIIEDEKLSYLLQGVSDFFNTNENTELQPLATDEAKGTFIYNILNDNYMNKYEYEESANDGQPYPNLEDEITLKSVDYGMGIAGCYHDSLDINGQMTQVAFNKSAVDQILIDTVGSTIKDGKNIKNDGLILDGDNYLFFNYKYYGSELILNRGRGTQFTINKINETTGNNVEIFAKYIDDAIELECSIKYKAEKNEGTFFGYKINTYIYSGCTPNGNFYGGDFPTQLVYGISEGIYSTQQDIENGEIREISIDLDNDGIDEYFSIGQDNPNGTKLLGIIGENGQNFLYDFTNEIVNEYNELYTGLSAEMYFEDFDSDEIIEVLVAVGDRKNFVEGIIYKKNGNNFEKIGDLHGKGYIEYVPYREDPDYRGRGPEYPFHMPYSRDGKCNVVNIEGNYGIYELVEDFLNNN